MDNAYELKNDKDYKKYATVSDRLMNDVNSEIDISDYSHALRDNDIRHINNSHGEGNPNEKYPVTRDDIKAIPSIVEEYDKVIVYKKSPQKVGLMYVKVSNDGLVYYLEQVTDQYGNEKLLVNKQMIKTGIDDIPDLKGLRDAITKKQSETEFLADLKARQVYAQSVYQSHSNNSISEKTEKINTFSENFAENNSNTRYALSADFDIAKGSISEEATKKAQSTLKELNQNTNAYDSNLRLSEGEKRNALAVDNYSEEEYNLSQENNSKNGENKNEQDYQNTGVLERGTLSTVSGSGNNKRSQGYDSSKYDDFLERTTTSRQRMVADSGSKRKVRTWLSKSGIRTKEDWIRFKKTFLRNWTGRIADTDASGRTLTTDIKEKFKDSVFKNENGELLSLYHWTASEFTDFAYGDVGFHFGTEKAAADRRSGKPDSQIGADITKEVYLNINNPIFLEDSGAYWDATEIATQLWTNLLISDEEYYRINHLHGAFDGEYTDEASVAVRELLKDLGYDGIIYSNAVEDRDSLSVIALYPEQIYTVAENGVDLEHSKDTDKNNKRYALSADFDIAKGSISEETTKKAQSTLKELKSRLKSTPSAIFNSN